MMPLIISAGANASPQWPQPRSTDTGTTSPATAPNQEQEVQGGIPGDESGLSPRLGSETADALLSAQQNAPSALEVFSAMDSNGDGLVDTSELTSYAALPPASPPHGIGGAAPAKPADELPQPDKELAAVISALSAHTAGDAAA